MTQISMGVRVTPKKIDMKKEVLWWENTNDLSIKMLNFGYTLGMIDKTGILCTIYDIGLWVYRCL